MAMPKPTEQDQWAGWRAGWDRLTEWVQRLDERSGGILSLFADTWHAFSEDDGGSRAAAIGYYALFSLFPLTVLLTLSLTYLTDETTARIQVMAFAAQYLPTDLRVVDSLVLNVLDNRGTLSTLAFLGVTWAGVQLFRVLERAINRAWGAPRRRGFLRHMGFSGIMVVTTGVLTLVSVALTALFEFIRQRNWDIPFTDVTPLSHPAVWTVVSHLPPFALSATLFLLLFRFVPHRIRVHWRDVWPGAVLAALLWEGAKAVFAFYMREVARQNYNLLYGSVGAIIVLLTWVYITGYIVLLGAEFCAVHARRRRGEPVARGQLTTTSGGGGRLLRPRHPEETS